MIEINVPVFFFVLGVVLTCFIGFFFLRQKTKQLKISNSNLQSRIFEIDTQMLNKTSEYENQLRMKHNDYSQEIDKLTREIRMLKNDHLIELSTKIREAEEKGFAEGKRYAELKSEEIHKSFSVRVRPWINCIKKDEFFSTSYLIQIGYSYQLFINGIPCFEPHIIVDQQKEEKSINMDQMISLATDITKLAVEIQAGAYKPFFQIFDRPIIENND